MKKRFLKNTTITTALFTSLAISAYTTSLYLALPNNGYATQHAFEQQSNQNAAINEPALKTSLAALEDQTRAMGKKVEELNTMLLLLQDQIQTLKDNAPQQQNLAESQLEHQQTAAPAHDDTPPPATIATPDKLDMPENGTTTSDTVTTPPETDSEHDSQIADNNGADGPAPNTQDPAQQDAENNNEKADTNAESAPQPNNTIEQTNNASAENAVMPTAQDNPTEPQTEAPQTEQPTAQDSPTELPTEAQAVPSSSQAQNATLSNDEAEQLYNTAYQQMLDGHYAQAEATFRAFKAQFPNDSKIAEATYFLGETLYNQESYIEAAKTYNEVRKNYQDFPNGAENLLKLGMTMSKLDNQAVACIVFKELERRYETLAPTLKQRIEKEQSNNHCP